MNHKMKAIIQSCMCWKASKALLPRRIFLV